MKKLILRSIFAGLLILFSLNFMPFTNSEDNIYIHRDIEFIVQAQREVGLSVIESTLAPLSNSSVHSYYGDTSNIDEIPTSNEYVEYDLRTGIQTISPRVGQDDIVRIDPTVFQPQKGIQPTYSGHLGDLSTDSVESDSSSSYSSNSVLPKPTYVFPPDDRVLVSNTSKFPFSSVVKIYVQAANGTLYIGSGAVIDEFHVLTVAHVAYIHDAGGWVTSMELVPGKKGAEEPYGSAYATHIRLYPEWINEARVEHDWALVTLDRSVGNLTGWMGIATYGSGNAIYSSEIYTAGYPGDLLFGEYMYNTTDDGDRADEYNHWFYLDTYGGQSGSAIWHVNATGEYIITILAYEYLNGVDRNFGTRINTQKYNQLATWLAQDTDPVKKPDFITIYAGSTLEAWSTVFKKVTQFGIFTDVQNMGTIPAEEVKTSFYLSKDNNVTTSDYLLGSIYVTNLEPMESDNADWIGTVPRNVPDGLYYMGWVNDPDNTIEEYNEDDNGGRLSIQIRVDSTWLQNFTSTPLGLGITIGVIAIVVILPIVGIAMSIHKRRKRKKMNMGYNSGYNPNRYQDPDSDWTPDWQP